MPRQPCRHWLLDTTHRRTHSAARVFVSIEEVSRHRTSVRAQQHFVDPPWNEPLDAEAAVLAVPEDALVRGFMTIPMIAEAKKLGMSWQPPRARYIPFNFYPLREHVQMLVWHCTALFPDLSLREALRKLGRGAPNALLGSTVGKVTMGSAEGVRDIVTAFTKAYELSLQPCSTEIIRDGRRHIIVSLASVPYFLDCHHVGAFEGAMKRAGVRGTVAINVLSNAAAHFLLEW
jgi:uncharacterized protein (TIGR02265 family)